MVHKHKLRAMYYARDVGRHGPCMALPNGGATICAWTSWGQTCEFSRISFVSSVTRCDAAQAHVLTVCLLHV